MLAGPKHRACPSTTRVVGPSAMLIYPGRIPKSDRDLKRAVPRTHLKVPRSGDYGNRYMIRIAREWVAVSTPP
jgi:hypothetical protein